MALCWVCGQRMQDLSRRPQAPDNHTALVLDSGQVVEACMQCSEAIRLSGVDQNRVPMDVVVDVRHRNEYLD